MSNQINTELLERAAEVMTYFEGTLVDKGIQGCLERNDLEMLEYIVKEAEYEIARQEFHNYDVLPKVEYGDVF